MVEYNELTGELVAELAAIVVEDNCLTGEDINEDYAHDDAYLRHAHARRCGSSANTDEVSAIMKLASANNIPVTVRGAGTGRWVETTPLAGGHCAMHHAYG